MLRIREIIKNNGGLSLIELMIVITLMAIVGAMGIMGLGLITNRPAEQCARQMQVSIERIRNTTMGKKEASLTFSVGADGTIMMQEKVDGGTSAPVSVGNSGVTVDYIVGGVTYHLIERPLVIAFDRGSGALIADDPTAGTLVYCSQIIVSKGSKTLTIDIDRLTGKVRLNQ